MSEFKIRKRETANFNTPQEMYDDYKNRKIEGIHDYQSKMIDLYLGVYQTEKDIAIELPTGTGKTLVGLLIGEFRRRKFKEKVVYLCPTKQLVNQTVEYSKKVYGIKAVGFTGSAKNYNPNDKLMYQTAQSIAITNYSSLFNTNSFFGDADILIFDDAHSGESYISSNWTVLVNRFENEDLYYCLAESIQPLIEDSTYSRLLASDATLDDMTWFDKIPNIKLVNNHSLIKKPIDEYLKANDKNKLKYPWFNIKNNLHACNVFLSWKEIVIRTYIPPTMSYAPFINAKQRIYMSATLGKSGELERAFGVPSIKKLPMVKDWENKTIGRKFFMFPFASFKEEQTGEIIKKVTELTPRVLMIVNDNDTQEDMKSFLEENTNVEVFTGKDIEESKEAFIKSNNGFTILANRFDGIDFPNEECRMLILFDLPNATHIQEKFLISRMAAMTLFEERIKTRIVQALGRCTRSHTDYAAVCIFGDDLMNSLLSPNKLVQFNAELQAELVFGQENSTEKSSIDEYLKLLNIFLNDRDKWEDAEEYILEIRDEKIEASVDINNTSYASLMSSSKNEVLAQYSIWKEDYHEALKHIDTIIYKLNDEALKGYRGFWSYIGGFCAYSIYKNGDSTYESVYKDYLNKAANTTISVNWFNKIKTEEDSKKESTNGMEYVIENIEKMLLVSKKKGMNKFFEELDSVLKLLESEDGEEFERGHELLGKWLGYSTFNPKGDAEPDPIWIIHAKLCIVSEDKIYEKDDKAIPVKHVKQAMGHLNWVNENVKKLSLLTNPKVITVFVSNSTKIEPSASIHGKDIYYISRDQLLKWAQDSFNVLKEIRRSFDSVGDVLWREKAIKAFANKKITPRDFVHLITSKKLSDI
ncbi:DEAD/DEAH box helicase family protein [Ruminiclostridium herbifermentans]|uniref:DEAD/DEAH box helicase family protein n=1 Tax=Ruminiclostridium herbifermentans TaxID=2488810 RepID=A0A4U7J617_9FIRM|nr:DEAD/DEAH box helicase family protein [Ruminiclostridium herbifermentans]QNU66556.1 DEAD/DEAH box helicase family protein [Ruminiclostridium herbifermentans]